MITLAVDGAAHHVDVDPETALLYVVRGELALNAAKFGCGVGQCGACTVMVDGVAVNSCITPISPVRPSSAPVRRRKGRPLRRLPTPSPMQPVPAFGTYR